jgi:hypothetical protein
MPSRSGDTAFATPLLAREQVEGLVSHTDSAALIYNSASSLLTAGAQVKRVSLSQRLPAHPNFLSASSRFLTA